MQDSIQIVMKILKNNHTGPTIDFQVTYDGGGVNYFHMQTNSTAKMRLSGGFVNLALRVQTIVRIIIFET